MNAPAVAPPQYLVDGVDVDAVARAVRGCPGVEDLHGGSPGEVATYLPGRRILGVRVSGPVVEVHVRAAWGVPVRQIAVGIQAAVAPLARGRAVDVTIADLGDPRTTGQIRAAPQPGTSRQAGATAQHAAEAAEAAGQLKAGGETVVGGQAVAKHAGPTSAGGAQGDPLLADALRDWPDRTAGRPERDRPEQVDLPAPPGRPARPPHAEGK